MLSLLVSLAISQAPALQALDALERLTVPGQRSSKLTSTPADVFTREGWSPDEAATIESASIASTAKAIGVGVASGLLVGGGIIAGGALDPSIGAWVGLASSLISFAVLTLGAVWFGAPLTSTLTAAFEARDLRVRKAALSSSDWDPVVVRTTSRLIGIGERDGRAEFVRDGRVVTEEQLAQLSPNPAEHTLARQRMKGGAAAAVALIIAAGLLLCAPPVILGATTLSPLGDLAVGLGASGASLIMLLIAGPLATAAAEDEQVMLDRFNTAVFSEARKELTRTPRPSIEPTVPATPPPAPLIPVD